MSTRNTRGGEPDRGTAARERFVGTAAVARALGVSVSTIKRWIDDGVLPAHRSGGGHRRLRGDEVVRAVRSQGLPFVDLDQLVGGGRPQANTPLRRSLLRALKRGQPQKVRELLLSVHQSGMPVGAIADDLIAPVMASIGHMCETGALDVGEEHRATHLCASGLFELKSWLGESRTATSAVAVGGGPEGDPYMVANLLAEMVLLEAGWNAVNLGPNTPLSALSAAIRRWRPSLVWLSMSYLPDARAFVRSYAELYKTAAEHRAAIIIGGRALTGELRDRLPSAAVGDNLTQLAVFARARSST